MKYQYLLFFIFICNYSFSQTEFSKGFESGYKEGYCQDQGIGCIPPIPPIAPLPNINEKSNSYKDGYNRGFIQGQADQKNKTSTNSNDRVRYQTAKPNFNIDFIYNPYKDQNIVDPKIKKISYIIDEANVHFNAKDYNSVINDADKMIKIEANFAVAYYLKSIAYYKMGDILDAYNNGVKQFRLHKSDARKDWYETIYMITSEYLSTLMSMDNFLSVQNFCENVWYKDQLTNYYLALSYYYQGNTKKAKNLFKKASDIKSSQLYLKSINNGEFISNPYKNDANSAKEKNELTNKIKELLNTQNYTEAINLINSEFNNFHKSYSYGIRGFCYYYMSNYSKAISDLTSAINNSDNVLPDFIYLRALSKAQLSDYNGAIADYETLIKLGEKNKGQQYDMATIYNNQAYLYCKLQNFEHAKNLAEKALQLNESHWYIWDTMGEIEYNLGNYSSAINALTNAINLNSNPNSYYYRALSFIKSKQREKGCQDLSIAGELGEKDAISLIKQYCN
ncbi:hypothetical protein NBRC110019_18200 [Neptunitalea chrysea]|uniref:Tetratricopeptide repeat protein n=1 Tax=Neptunitalea chrysea TaxID=1647581 RepID=A0A9W6B575_9FLAO|nr:tetratricopeptide repeat protein [Neptunitalea chrysea]GLB52780.1 hypothetical protein NBRC110019_18200 [Neptunitalea chrysea]